jgi:hypothetical protein
MKPGFYEMPSFVRGDTWNGVGGFVITVDGVAPDTTLISVKIDFRVKKTSPTVSASLNSEVVEGSGTITIDDATNWEISIPSQTLDLDAGTYVWDMETVDSEGTVKTYLEGTIKVLQDVTV